MCRLLSRRTSMRRRQNRGRKCRCFFFPLLLLLSYPSLLARRRPFHLPRHHSPNQHRYECYVSGPSVALRQRYLRNHYLHILHLHCYYQRRKNRQQPKIHSFPFLTGHSCPGSHASHAIPFVQGTSPTFPPIGHVSKPPHCLGRLQYLTCPVLIRTDAGGCQRPIR